MTASTMSRRGFLGVVGAAGMAMLAGCSAGEAATHGAAADGAPTTGSSAESEGAATDVTTATAADGAAKTLVAYFSGTGNTRRVAEIAADELGADLFELTPVEPYTSDDLDYNASDSRVVRENDEGATSVPLAALAPEGGLAAYDRILFGYPIWWQDAAWPVGEFVEGNDFTGKVVVPFCTSASSPAGESGAGLAKRAGTGDWQTATRFGSSAAEADVRDWAR